MPGFIPPMLATLTDKPFDAPGWLYEIKWDGYRAAANVKKNKVELYSRNNKSFNEKFYPVVASLEKFGFDAVLDGEVIVANEQGMADFGKLQNWRSEADGTLLFYVFDILWYAGKSLLHLPLIERRDILKAVLPANDTILLSNDFEASGLDFFRCRGKNGFGRNHGQTCGFAIQPRRAQHRLVESENVRSDMRSSSAGFTKNEGTAKHFSSLLVGVFEKKKLIYTGKIGTGFTDKMQREMMKQFAPLVTDKSPFDVVPDVNKPSRFRPTPPKAAATWLRPELVCEVSYRELTSDGVMRHPSFEGMRSDKPAAKVKKR